MLKPRVLMVEDVPKSRSFDQFLADSFNIDMSAPDSFESLKKKLLFESFDGALLDIRLSKWDIDDSRSQNIDGYKIMDGIDVGRFYHGMHREAAIALHSAFLNDSSIRKRIEDLPFDVITIPKPIDISLRGSEFSPFVNAALQANRTNSSWLLEIAKYQQISFNERLQFYDRACHLNAKWLDTLFNALGPVSWTMICDRKAELFGQGLGGDDVDLSGYGIKSVPYPHQDALISLATGKDLYPFIFWNTKKPAYLGQQFEAAGENLKNIPAGQRDFFGLSMALTLAEAYEAEADKKTLEWCQHLNRTGQIETCKQIWKRFIASDKPYVMDRFNANCSEFNLPIIVDIFKARVDDIETAKTTAYIELVKWEHYRPIKPEAFNLDILRENGVKYVDQNFEYTVYKFSTGEIGMNIKLIAPE